MAKVTKTPEEAQLAARFECGSCEREFAYGPGFPDYCPECGEEFTETEDCKKGGK